VIKRSRVLATRPSVPPAIAGEGYELVWEQNFSGTLDTSSTWRLGLCYESHTPTSEEVFVSDRTLKLVCKEPRAIAVRLSPRISQKPPPTRGNEGISRARIRMNNGPGNFPAFWMPSKMHRFNASYPTPACPEPTCLSG
jgi:hypothetical protein